MLHVKDFQAPCYSYFDITQVFEEFIDHSEAVRVLSSKNTFVSQYNDWAQRSNLHLRSLRDTKKKWQELSYRYQAYAKVRTLLYVISCAIGLWIGSWNWAVLSLISHILAECVRPILHEKVCSATHVKPPLKCIFLTIFKMKTFLAQIHNKLKISCHVSSRGVLEKNDFFDEPRCYNPRGTTPSSITFAFPIVFSVTASFVTYAVYNWTAEAFFSHCFTLLTTVAFISLSSYTYFAYAFRNHCSGVQSQLAADSEVFFKSFDDWMACEKIGISFCHCKLCFLNLMPYEDMNCTLGNTACKFSTVWFLLSLERLLESGLRNSNSKAAITRMFSSIPTGIGRYLDVQYILGRLQHVLKPSHSKSGLVHSHLQNVPKASSRPHSGPGNEMTSHSDLQRGPRQNVRKTSAELHSYFANKIRTTGSSSGVRTSTPRYRGAAKKSSSHIPVRSFHTKNMGSFLRSTSSIDSRGNVSYYSAESSQPEYLKTAHRMSTHQMSSSGSSAPGDQIKMSSQDFYSKVKPNTVPRSEVRSSVSSESVLSSTQGSDPYKISASESSVSSEHQKFGCSSEGNTSSVPIISDTTTNQPDQDFMTSILNKKQLNGVKGSHVNFFSVTSAEANVKPNFDALTQSAMHFNKPESGSTSSVNLDLTGLPLGKVDKSRYEVGNAECDHIKTEAAEQKDDRSCSEYSLLRSNIADSSKAELSSVTNRKIQDSSEQIAELEAHDSNFCTAPITEFTSKPRNRWLVDGNFMAQGPDLAKGHQHGKTGLGEVSSRYNGKHENSSELSLGFDVSRFTSDYYSVVHGNTNTESEFFEHPNHHKKNTENFLGSDDYCRNSERSCSSDHSAVKCETTEILSPSTESVRHPVLVNEHQTNDCLLSEENAFNELCFPDQSRTELPASRHRKTRPGNGILMNRNVRSPEVADNEDDLLHSDVHEEESSRTGSYVDSTGKALLSPKSAGDSSVSEKSLTCTSEEDSEELSFPMASSDDENFRFRPESGCTTDTLYSETNQQQKNESGFTVPWRRRSADDESEPAYANGLAGNGATTVASTDGDKGIFKFDNFEFKYDLKSISENVTLKFYCESEGEYNESASPSKRRKSHNALPKDEKPRPIYCYKVPFPFPDRQKQERTVELSVDGIDFNFKRRKNSGPIKVQYHRRSESKDFLFKSRFKRFRFRCGNTAPISEPYGEHGEQESYDEHEEQESYKSSCNVEHSENDSIF